MTSIARLDALISGRDSLSRSGGGGVPLDASIARLRASLRDALFDAGLCERRAMLTGTEAHAFEYAEALQAVDAAHSELWAHEALGRQLRVLEVDARRAALASEVAEGGAEVSRQIAEGHPEPSLAVTLASIRAANMALASTWPLPVAAIEVPGSGGGIMDVRTSAADQVTKERRARIRRRLAKTGGALVGGGSMASSWA